MATLYEYYNTGDDDLAACFADKWQAQSFTPSTAHKITSVKLKLYREGSPGTLTVSIQGVNGSGHPDGSDLCSGTTDGNTLTTSSDGEWREITLGAGANLSADTQYAIVIRVLDGSHNNEVKWRIDLAGATYDGGISIESNDAGVNWTDYTDTDNMFEDWGEAIVTAPTVTTQDATGIGID